MPFVRVPLYIDPADVFALAREQAGPAYYLDSARGDAGRGERSVVVLELGAAVAVPGARIAELLAMERGARRRARQALLEPIRASWRAGEESFAGSPLGWFGWVAYDAAPLFDEGFETCAPSGEGGAVLQAREGYAGVLFEEGTATLVAAGETASVAESRAAFWAGRLATGVAQRRATSCDISALQSRSLVDMDRYRSDILAILDSIGRGEHYQACYTFPIEVDAATDLGALYEALRGAYGGDFGVWLRDGAVELACVSPERFLRVRGRTVEARPMKGTRRLSGSEAADAERAAELLGSEKDRAENVMIVDLLRNDLGRVAQVGTVEVPELFTIERYATVAQMTSTVRARLRCEIDPVDLLEATFPPGSMTGAPRIAACNHLAQLEGHPRGLYAGSVFWLGRDARWEFNVVIRGVQRWAGRCTWHVGGGIVADSDPDAEWDEALAKAAPLLGRGGRVGD
jgi:anthranilate/para-aminobenzoate synthase component I